MPAVYGQAHLATDERRQAHRLERNGFEVVIPEDAERVFATIGPPPKRAESAVGIESRERCVESRKSLHGERAPGRTSAHKYGQGIRNRAAAEKRRSANSGPPAELRERDIAADALARAVLHVNGEVLLSCRRVRVDALAEAQREARAA